MNGLEEEREDRQKHLCDGTGGAGQLFQGLVTSLLSYLAFVKEGIVFTLPPTQNNTPPPTRNVAPFHRHWLKWLRVLLHSYLLGVL